MAFIRGRFLYEGGVYLTINLLLANNSMQIEHLNLKIRNLFLCVSEKSISIS